MNTIKVSEVVYREDLYPRFKPNPSKIQEYAENLELLPPIEVSQHHILIDGYHRWKAYQTAGVDEIPCVITEVKSEQELLMLAVRRNAAHGQQLTQEEKKRYAIRWWDVLPDDEIIETLSISRQTFLKWTRDKRREKEAEQKHRVYDLWMRCETQERIADQVGVDQATASRWIADFMQIEPEADSHIFRDFEPELYTVTVSHSHIYKEPFHYTNLCLGRLTVVTDVLGLAKKHQTGRVTEKVTNVTFTERWFRNSGGTS